MQKEPLHQTDDSPRIPHSDGSRLMLLLVVAFLLIFPKGGIKIAQIPITWGYLLLGALSFAMLARNLYARALPHLPSPRRFIFTVALPFQILALVIIATNGYDSVGYTLAFVVGLVFLPLAFNVLLAPQIDRLDLDFLFVLVRHGIFLLAAYGILLFAYKQTTGHFIEIPFITVNYGDLGHLEEKFIDRGGIFKLISTYNNGNIFGVSMLLLLPLYHWLEQSAVKRNVVKFALVLTLSRTVWIGLILYEILDLFLIRKVSARSLRHTAVSLVILAAEITFAVWLIHIYQSGSAISFIADPNLGGRAAHFTLLRFDLWPPHPVAFPSDIVYLSVNYAFGTIGLALFVAAMASPLWLLWRNKVPLGPTSYKRSLALGLTLYLIVSGSDGAILLIPVMAFYWFVVALLLSENAPRAVSSAPPGEG